MTVILIRKLLRDLRLPLLVVCLLLTAYQALWAKITHRTMEQVLPQLFWLAGGRGVTPEQIEQFLFEGPLKLTRPLIGGESISLFRVRDMLTVGYVHPVMLTVFCVWAIGRAAGAVAGEIDRGTMELLMAQPLPRSRVILAQLCVDVITIPLLCLSMWLGNWIGVGLLEIREIFNGQERIDPTIFSPALWNVAALIFAVEGYTLWLSAAGRFRGRVLGLAVLVTLVQVLVNTVGMMWDAVAFLRPFTVFYYYQPQQIILNGRWTVDLREWNGGEPMVQVPMVAVLFAVGAVGYLLALWTFTRRDLPAPL